MSEKVFADINGIRQGMFIQSVPPYFFHGVHYYTVDYQLAKDYHDRLAAILIKTHL